MRARAAEVLLEVVHHGASLDGALQAHLSRVNAADRSLFKELCFGSLRWYWRCKGVIDQLMERPLKRRDRVIEALLILGIYQLDQLRLPAHAALHTTVEACAALKRPKAKGLVNAVLRNFQRRGAALIEALNGAARDAHPDWLWRRIHDEWPERAGAIIAANNHRPPMALRVNTRAVSVVRYLEALADAGIEARPVPNAPAGVVLERGANVDKLPGFDQGWVTVQDASAQLLPALVAPAAPRRILDACAAPGGKLTHLLESFPEASVQAVEVDAERARRIGDNLQRLGLAAEVAVADAGLLDDWWDGRPFDVIVLDVPCSGTGVIRRHPDIKVLRRASDIAQFAAQQQRLLERLWPALESGGLMVYVTCSILAAENQDRIQEFVDVTSDSLGQPVGLPDAEALSQGCQVLPAADGGDGFYYAVLRKG